MFAPESLARLSPFQRSGYQFAKAPNPQKTALVQQDIMRHSSRFIVLQDQNRKCAFQREHLAIHRRLHPIDELHCVTILTTISALR